MLQLISILKHIIARNFSLRKKKFSHISCLSPHLTDAGALKNKIFILPSLNLSLKTPHYLQMTNIILSGSIDKNNLVALTCLICCHQDGLQPPSLSYSPLNAPASMPLLSSSLCVPCNIQSKAFSQSPNIRGIHKKEGTITLFNEWSADYSETLHLYKTSSFTFCLLFGSLTTQNKTLGLGNQPDVNTFALLCLLLLACFIHVINPSRILK